MRAARRLRARNEDLARLPEHTSKYKASSRELCCYRRQASAPEVRSQYLLGLVLKDVGTHTTIPLINLKVHNNYDIEVASLQSHKSRNIGIFMPH